MSKKMSVAELALKRKRQCADELQSAIRGHRSVVRAAKAWKAVKGKRGLKGIGVPLWGAYYRWLVDDMLCEPGASLAEAWNILVKAKAPEARAFYVAALAEFKKLEAADAKRVRRLSKEKC